MAVVNLTKKSKNISFSNIFMKRFITRLILLFIMTVPTLILTNNIMINICNQKVEAMVADTTIDLMELTSLNLADAKYQNEANKILSKMQDQMVNDKFISDVSMSMYNTKRKTLIAKSYEIVIVESDELMNWWIGLTENNINTTPSVTISAGAKSFIDKYSDKHIYAEKIVCVNSVLFPSSLTVRDDDGKKLDEYSEITPSVNSGEFKQRLELLIVGNTKNSTIYNLMSDYEFVNETGEVNYKKGGFDNIQMIKKTFELDGYTYQVDCGYHFNFWQNTMLYIFLIELIAALLCALSAFINTKETMSIYS